MRRATVFAGSTVFKQDISIHALREEGDFGYQEAWADYRIFLSTPSVRRATEAAESDFVENIQFLSTPSVRRATV